MTDITITRVAPRQLAAVRRRVTIGQIAGAWKPALDQVWACLRAQSVRTGHNVFLYLHPTGGEDVMTVDFGVEVLSPFDPDGEVHAATTPAGEVAMATHVGAYADMAKTHRAIHAWSVAERRPLAGLSWEIYGDWDADPAKLTTTICYLLG